MNIIKKLLSIFKKKVDSRIQNNFEKKMSKENLQKHIADVVNEYNLIQQSKSKLSRRERDNVVAYMAKLEELDYVKINRDSND